MNNQIELANRILDIGINIVTCGHCGSVILHEKGVNTLKCYDCEFESDISDFPDLYYNA